MVFAVPQTVAAAFSDERQALVTLIKDGEATAFTQGLLTLVGEFEACFRQLLGDFEPS